MRLPTLCQDGCTRQDENFGYGEASPGAQSASQGGVSMSVCLAWRNRGDDEEQQWIDEGEPCSLQRIGMGRTEVILWYELYELFDEVR